jgi:long-chain acyl-CoA synthetase
MSEPQSLEHWAATTPDKPAIIEGDRTLTYAQWNHQADRLAHGLRAYGVDAGDIIVARTHTRLEWPIIQAAVGKIGGRLLVLNWRLTPSEIRFVIGDSAAHAFLCDDANPTLLASALEGYGLKLAVSLDAAAPGFVGFDALFRDGPALIAEGDPPLIVYTSGTTGLPKGVEAARRPPMKLSSSRNDVMLINMPMHHASAPNQLIRARANNWTVVLQRRFDAVEALDLIERHKVSQWAGVPTMFKRIVALPADELARRDMSALRAMSIGGGPTPWVLKEQIIAVFGPGKLAENYGATEVGMITNLPAHMQEAKRGSCGKLYAGVEVEIRDEAGDLVPTGEVGIIWCRTPTTISAYLNQGTMASDRRDDRGFFKVGDLGRFDEDGFLYLTDRAIDMIVSGGVNIYPAEIEACLLQHPAVQDAAVVGGPDEEFGEEVLAYIELKPGRVATPDDLARHCKTELASYKRPRRIEIVADLPRNTMGKLLKSELRAPLWAGRDRAI